MNAKTMSYLALLCAILAIVLHFESRARLEQGVQVILNERERNYWAQIAIKLNQSRELMGLEPVKPENFAEVLSAYFETMANVMNEGISKTPAEEDARPTCVGVQ
jgi:hypothetical protein